jgi:HPt (histidine-containing phosphotransfer) domain-containing protein
MNDEQAQIRERMQQLGVKFARRTQGELVSMRALVEQARQGNADAVRSLEQLAHKIHGTGATFGLTGISGSAAEIERMASQAVAGTVVFDDACAARAIKAMARLQSELDLFGLSD